MRPKVSKALVQLQASSKLRQSVANSAGSKSSPMARKRATRNNSSREIVLQDNAASLPSIARTEDEQDKAAVEVLCMAFERICRLGWAPLEAVLFRERNEFERRRLAGSRTSLLVAIRRSETKHWMTDQARALLALERLCGMYVHQREALPMVSQEDVLGLLCKAIVSLGGKRPLPAVRRGGWAVLS